MVQSEVSAHRGASCDNCKQSPRPKHVNITTPCVRGHIIDVGTVLHTV